MRPGRKNRNPRALGIVRAEDHTQLCSIASEISIKKKKNDYRVKMRGGCHIA